LKTPAWSIFKVTISSISSAGVNRQPLNKISVSGQLKVIGLNFLNNRDLLQSFLIRRSCQFQRRKIQAGLDRVMPKVKRFQTETRTLCKLGPTKLWLAVLLNLKNFLPSWFSESMDFNQPKS
jgi:hypothetical protein